MMRMERSRKTRLLYLALLALVLGSAARGAGAADVRTLTLPQVLELADSRNRDVEKAREFYRQVEGKYVEERSAALPQFTITSHASRDQDDSQKAFSGGFFPTQQNSYAVDLGLTQALYTWGKVGAAIRAAEKGFKTADERLRVARQDARRDAEIAFYDILLDREQLAIAQQNLEQKERHRDEAQRRYAIGVATDYDVLAAAVSVENARPETIRSANQLRSSRDRLRFILALDEDIDVSGTLERAELVRCDYEEALATALRRRPELAELRWRAEITDELVRITDADDKPRLDLKAAAGWRRLDAGSITGDGKEWALGVYLTFPVFDGLKTRGRVAQVESERRSLGIEEKKLKESISLEVRNAVNGVREAEEIVAALTGTVGQAERLLAMAEKGYELGVKIRLEVDDAELNLLRARGNLARARRDYLAARAILARVTGVSGE